MQTSIQGIRSIARREAYVAVPYMDGGHYSWGFGENSPDIKPGMTINLQDALKRLVKSVREREVILNRMLKMPVNQRQYDALMSAYYQGGTRTAGPLVALINAGYPEAAVELFPFLDKNKAGERKEGLRKRRVIERDIFTDGEYDLSPIPAYYGDPRDPATKTGLLELTDADFPQEA